MRRWSSVDALRFEVQTDPEGLSNLVANPSGELGGFGWVTPVDNALLFGAEVDGVSRLRYMPPGFGAPSYLYTEPLPVVAGEYVAASWVFLKVDEFYRARLEWLDGQRAVLSSSTQTGYLSSTGVTVAYGPLLAPAGTAYCRLRFDHYADAQGAPALVGDFLDFRAVTVATAASQADLGSLRTNLVPNPSFETNLDGWLVGSSTVERVTGGAWVGAAAMRLQKAAAESTAQAWTRVPVVGGATYTGSAYVKCAGAKGSLFVSWYGEDDVLLSSTALGSRSTGAGAWERVSGTWTAPSGARWAYVRTYGDSYTDPAADLRFDGLLFERSTAVGRYFGPGTVRAGYSYVSTSESTMSDPVVTTNLVRNPSAETNAAGWTFDHFGADALISSTAQAHAGARSFELRADGDSSNSEMRGDAIPVVPGRKYTFRVAVRVGSSMGVDNSVTLSLYVGSTAAQAETTGVSYRKTVEDLPTLTWVVLTLTVTVSAESDYYWLSPQVRFRRDGGGSAPAGTRNYADGAMLTEGPETEFFDGATPDTTVTKDYLTTVTTHDWTGTAHASESTRTVQTTRETITHQEISSTLAYIEPVQFANILGPTHDLKVVRDELDVGTLSALVLDTTLDPAVSSAIRPGRVVRLTADAGDGDPAPLFTGRIRGADVDYDLRTADPTKVARIQIEAADAVAELANTSRPEGVASIAQLPWVLEGAGVPWNVNGSGDQVLTAGVVSRNENASALDQVAMTRDSTLGYAWVDQEGVLNAWDRDELYAVDGATTETLAATNLWSNPVPALSVAPWSRFSGSDPVVLTPDPVGGGSVLFTRRGVGTHPTILAIYTDHGTDLPAAGAYVFSAELRVPSGGTGSGYCSVGGSGVAGVNSQFVAERDQWVPIEIAFQWDGAGTAIARIHHNGGAPGDRVLVRHLMTSPGDVPSDWFSGDTPDTATDRYDWTGAPHASTSTRTAIIPAGTVLDESDYSDLVVAFSTSRTINEVRITLVTADGEEVPHGPYRDSTSIREWGVYSREVTVHGLTTAQIEDLAAAILAANAVPRARVTQLTLPIRSAADVVEGKALLDLYDLVVPTNVERAIAEPLRVTGIEHQITPSRWVMVVQVDDEGGVASPAIAPPVQSGLSVGGPVPVGGVVMHGAAGAPSGWLECDGASHATADFPDLFAVIGYVHGGSGATFRVPNLTDRFPIGAGTKAVGTSGGSSTVSIGTANLPAHSHTMDGRTTGPGTQGNVHAQASGGGAITAGQTSSVGSGTALSVLNPWRSLTFLIRAT